MTVDQNIHRAFRIDYGGIVRELVTIVHVSIPAILSGGRPQFRDYRAVWDTGATNTCVTARVAQELGLTSTGATQMSAVNGTSIVNTYFIDLGLPNKVNIANVDVAEVQMDDYDLLIGMDIIQAGDFAISKRDGCTSFSFCMPSHDNPTCLLEKSERVNEKIAKKFKLKRMP